MALAIMKLLNPMLIKSEKSLALVVMSFGGNEWDCFYGRYIIKKIFGRVFEEILTANDLMEQKILNQE